MRIALGQLESGTDIAANLAAIDRFAACGPATAPRWWPSRSTPRTRRRSWTRRFPAVAEPLDGPSAGNSPPPRPDTASRWWRAWWRASDEPGKAYNTLVAFGPSGARLAVYRKIHLFDAQGFGESTFIKPGPSTDPVVFESGGARFGLMTCYDLRFPELARSLADAGAQVLLVCSSWVPGTHKTEQWLALNAARGDREQRVRGWGVPGPAGLRWPQPAGGSDGRTLRRTLGWSRGSGGGCFARDGGSGDGSSSRCSGSGGCSPGPLRYCGLVCVGQLQAAFLVRSGGEFS